jgi:uncharacterized membrane protein YfcA
VGTSILSAMVGMAGGIVLLAIMLLYFDPLVAIPIPGATQLLANSSRPWVQRASVSWRIVGLYALPLLPAGALGLPLAQAMPPRWTKLAIGVFVLLATWAPRFLGMGARSEPADPETVPARRVIAIGAVTGFLAMHIGATGPLQAPFFLRLRTTRQGVVGTFAASQTCSHLAKVTLFGVGGFAFREHLGTLAALCTAAVVGTWIGSQLLGRVSERAFRVLFQGVLTLVALRLVIWEGLGAG